MSRARLLLCAPLVLLAACSGGGGGGGGTPPPGTHAVSLSGAVTYDFVNHFLNGALNYSSIVSRPVRGASVELRAGSGATACGNGALIASAVTSATGNYTLTATTSGSVVVCVYAELQQTGSGATPGWEFLVVDNTRSKAVYSLASNAISVTAPLTTTIDLHAASGWGGTGYTSTRAAAPFAILDVVYDALQKILSVDSDVQLPRLRLNWSVDNRPVDGNVNTGAIGTSYFNVESGSNEIYILGAANTDTDEYDDHVVAHEFGHYMEQVLSRSDSLGGSHTGDDRLDMRVAYGEGFGNAWSGIVFDDPRYTDSFGSAQGSGFWIEVETDTTTTPGWFNETSVQAFIYDAYDSTNEAGDTVSLGLAPLYSVWTGAQRTTPALTSIFPLLDGLRDANAGSAAALTALATANAINGTDEWGAGETNSGGLGSDALPVYTVRTPGAGTFQVCASNTEGTYNKLGNRRFIRFDQAAGGDRTISVAGAAGDDPDAVLYSGGTEVVRSEVIGNESFQRNLAAGTYVLEVYPWERTVDSGAASGSYCLQVTIN
jgi:hypothetical protein